MAGRGPQARKRVESHFKQQSSKSDTGGGFTDAGYGVFNRVISPLRRANTSGGNSWRTVSAQTGRVDKDYYTNETEAGARPNPLGSTGSGGDGGTSRVSTDFTQPQSNNRHLTSEPEPSDPAQSKIFRYDARSSETILSVIYNYLDRRYTEEYKTALANCSRDHRLIVDAMAESLGISPDDRSDDQVRFLGRWITSEGKSQLASVLKNDGLITMSDWDCIAFPLPTENAGGSG